MSLKKWTKHIIRIQQAAAMSEGKKTEIVLLDDRRLEILTQPKLEARELLDLVASHFNLKEKEYFGLAYRDDTGHMHWLQLDRRVLEHDFPPSSKKSDSLILYFCARFFIESIAYLRDSATIELFFLQAKHSLYKETLDCDAETVFELAAYALQASVSDFSDEETARKYIKKLPLLPTRVLQEHPSISYCENKVIEHYRKLSGTSRGSAIVSYMTLVEGLPTYGVHYYEVKDKSGIPWWLGLSYKGISQYDFSDKRIPRKVFAWKQLENLYFRDRKFSIEVHDPKRIVHTLSSFNLYEDAIAEPRDQCDELSDAISDPTTQVSVSRRTFGPGNVNVHAWFAATPQLTKCIWSMAVNQHQFYLDRKQSKSTLPTARSVSEIAADLCTSTTSLQSSGGQSNSGGGGDNISRSNSTHSLSRLALSTHSSKTELTAEDLEASRQASRDMHTALKARKEALEVELAKKVDELRQLCLKEGEITGEVPFEYPLSPGEEVPNVPRRVGTGFTLSPNVIYRSKDTEEEELIAKLELEYELQDKITQAARQLAKDPTVAKSVRKKRKNTYHKSSQKLKDIEKKLNEFRKHQGKNLLLKDFNSADELSEDSREFLDSDNEILSPSDSPQVPTRHNEIINTRHPHSNDQYHHQQQRSNHTGYHGNNKQYGGGGHHGYPRSASQGQVEVVELEHMRPSTPSSQGSGQRSGSPASQGHSQGRHPYSHGMSRGSTPSPGPNRRYGGGYNQNPAYTNTMYRNASYPNFSSRQQQQQTPPTHAQNNMDYEQPIGGSHRGHDRVHQSQAPSHYTSIPPSMQQQQDVVHNMYNLNLNQTTCYNSMDELKQNAPHGTGDHSHYNYSNNAPNNSQYHGSRSFPRTGSYDNRATSHGEGGGYNHPSLERDRRTQQQEPVMIPELIPSKFGSKRESHSDHRDSPYYNGPAPTRHDLGGNSGYVQNSHPDYSVAGKNVGAGEAHRTTHYAPPSSIPFIDSSHSSLTSSASSNYHYEQSGQNALRQQNPPSTPQFETPPTAFIRQESPLPQGNQNYHGTHQQSNFESPKGPQLQPPPQGGVQSMTVTKYSNYVEVSKPFEMADVYKYSEKIRKTRHEHSPTIDGAPQSPAHSSASGSSSQRAQSPFLQRTAPHLGQSRSRSASPLPSTDSSTNQYSSSQYSHAHHHSQHQSGRSHSMTPVTHAQPPPPPPQSNSQSQKPYQTSMSASHLQANQNARHMPYNSPQGHSQGHSGSSTPHRSFNDSSQNGSFGSFHLPTSEASDFSQEMLDWYDDSAKQSDSRTGRPKTPNHYQRQENSTLV